jgi:ABC-type Fe3+-hydroxamate transport system substrate-binding protein
VVFVNALWGWKPVKVNAIWRLGNEGINAIQVDFATAQLIATMDIVFVKMESRADFVSQLVGRQEKVDKFLKFFNQHILPQRIL